MDNNIKTWHWKCNNISNSNSIPGIESLMVQIIEQYRIFEEKKGSADCFFYVHMKIKALCVCAENRNFI